MQDQQTVSIPSEPNDALSSRQAAAATVVTNAECQLSVPVLPMDLTMESAAVPTECSSPKKGRNSLTQNILLWAISCQT